MVGPVGLDSLAAGIMVGPVGLDSLAAGIMVGPPVGLTSGVSVCYRNYIISLHLWQKISY